MSGDHIAIAIDQDRDIEAKHSDAFGNLLDLFLAVSARVCRVRFKLGSRAKDDLQASLVVLRFNRFRSLIRMHIDVPTIDPLRPDNRTRQS